ncbi:DUF6011 domain-containing protein [Mycolicibacterium austroafricanum]|uniref:DUF6011 domain-containing protein n=1 Tax=Mycolicibacterium austroafricanum TaxID=39687 RepID=A0ABT8HHS7_MYCAO|nr:DUF6011 domain-containing protein [Mycolicibacterium austroafricanum]MDN4520318.1 DUF6011 domain-containing protein [Mycolicibacterium austroafricanum]QZT71022.1 DUF6011 domain-containing protein [Mycolicibacterium austroafricanum]
MTKAKAPAPRGNRHPAQHRANGYADSSLNRAEDGYQAPTPEERREAALRAELAALGYRVSVRCRVCGHPVVSAKSVAAHIGPKCAAKVVAE